MKIRKFNESTEDDIEYFINSISDYCSIESVNKKAFYTKDFEIINNYDHRHREYIGTHLVFTLDVFNHDVSDASSLDDYSKLFESLSSHARNELYKTQLRIMPDINDFEVVKGFVDIIKL